jgi:CHU_C Type IX secretion signal domain
MFENTIDSVFKLYGALMTQILLQKTLTTLLFVVVATVAMAQVPDPCSPQGSTQPAENCASACINCNFNGYMGNSGGFAPDAPAPGWCSMIQNDQWLGFIAGITGSVTFNVIPSNCANGDGLQAAVYSSGCDENPLGCNPGGGGQGNTTITFTVPLTQGSNYYLIIDGLSGDACDFTILVQPAIGVQAPVVGPVGVMTGPTTICPGATATYSVPTVTGAGYYRWYSNNPGVLFNGSPGPVDLESLEGGRTVQVTFPNSATPYTTQICVVPLNSCSTGQPRCTNVNVAPIPKTVFPLVTLCAEDAMDYTTPWGGTISTTPNTTLVYNETLDSYRMCDSVLEQRVRILPLISSPLQVRYVCKGTPVSICDVEYVGTGLYTEVCDSYAGCDSTVTLNIRELDPIADIIGGGVLSCSNTSITLNSAASPTTPGSSIKLWRLAGDPMVLANGNTLTVTNPGTYVLTTTMSAGGTQCIATDTVVITGNTSVPSVSTTNGVIGCGLATAIINANGGGTGGTYQWSGPSGFTSGLQSPTVSEGGTYTVTVTSGTNGCTATGTATVGGNTTAPSAVIATPPLLTCTASTVALSASTNAAAATYAWSGPGGYTAAGATPNITVPGTYVVTVTSSINNCTSTASAMVDQNIAAPGVNASATGTIGCTTPTIPLTGNSPAGSVTYAWSGPGGFTGSGQTVNVGTSGTYTVVAQSTTNGCTSTTTVDASGNTNLPTASAITANLSCGVPADTLFGSSTTPGATFAWNGPVTSTTSNVIANVPGTYTLVVTAPNTCTATATAVVTGDYATPQVSATGNTISCTSSSTTITASSTTPGALITWVGPGGTTYSGGSVSVNTAGDYTATATAPNGCTASQLAVVVPDANVPNISVVGDTINCLSATASIIGNSNTPGIFYTWSGPGISPANVNNATQSVTVSGNYQLVVTNPGNGCSAVATAVVLLDTGAPGVTTGNDTLTCDSPNLQIFASSTTPNVTYAWTGTNFTSAVQNPTVSASGSYTVVATAANGCTSSATAIIAANQDIPVLSLSTGTLTCATTSVTLNSTSNLPVGFAWAGPAGYNSTLEDPTTTTPGTYTVTATASNGCSATSTIVVNLDNADPDVSTTGGTITCAALSVGLTGNSTTVGAAFEWFAQNGTSLGTQQNITATAPGNYSLVVTGTNGCQATSVASVQTNQEAPILQITNPNILTCALTTQALQLNALTTISNVTGYVWSGPGTFTSGIEDPNITNPGTYTVVVTSDNGCTASASIQVQQNIVAPNVSAANATLNCTVTSLNLNGGSTSTNPEFLWTGPGINASNAAVEDPAIAVAGTYTLQVTGENGCTATATAVVASDLTAPGATITSSNVLTCTQLNATLTAGTTLGTTYTWSGPGIANETSSTITVGTPATYSVLITGANGCTSTQTFDQTQNIAQPELTAVGGTIDCTSGVVTLQGNSTNTGVSYFWTGPNNFTSPLQNPIVGVDGTYTLVVTGSNGCTNSMTADVLENQQSPNVEITGAQLLTCDLTTVTLQSVITTPNTTLEWELPNGTTATTDSIQVSAPGVYTLTVTSLDNGCISMPFVNIGQNIAEPQNVEVEVSGLLDCANPTVTLTSSSTTSNATYAWTGPGGYTSPQQSPSVSTAGPYELIVTNPVNGCTTSFTLSVDSDTNFPSVSVATTTITCAQLSAVLNSTSSVPTVTYQWAGPSNFNSTQADPPTTVAGNYTVTVTNTTNSCTATATVTVPLDQQAPSISTSNDTITCTQPSIALIGSSMTPNVTYVWTTPSNTTIGQQSPTISQPGNYTLVVTSTTNGCTSSSVAIITPDQNIPVVTASGGLLTCAITSLVLNGTSNKPDVTWSWTGPNNYTSTNQNATINNPGTYTLIVTTTNGCSGQASGVVTANTTPPNVSIAQPQRLDCNTTQVPLAATVNGTSTYGYAWATQNGNISAGNNTATATAVQAGAYALVVTDQVNGCTSLANINVEVDPAVPSGIPLTTRDVSCFGFTNGVVTLGQVQGGTAPYLFSVDNQPFVAATAFNALAPGAHTIRLQDANGCEFETTFDIGEPNALIVNLGPDTTIRLGDLITLSLNNTVNEPNRVTQTVLDPPALDTVLCATCNPTFQPIYSLQYNVAVVDSNGCRAEDERRIIVDRTRRIYVPTVFEPNGSGDINSYLQVFGGNDVKSIRSFRVYDRWGASVFQYDGYQLGDINGAWDGKIRGELANPAVFVWALEVEFKDGEIELFAGDTALIRQ